MGGETWGEVQVLRSLGRDLHGRTAAGRGPVADYDLALAVLAAAPMSPELARPSPSRAPAIDALLEVIGVADTRLVAYADALAWADANLAGFDGLSAAARREILYVLTDHLLAGRDLDGPLDPEAAAALGEHAAQLTANLLAADDTSIEDWQELRELLDGAGDDPTFAAAFFAALGPEATAELPGAIGEAWGLSDGARGWPMDTTAAWDVLLSVSTLLATASHTIGTPDGLPASFVDDLLAAPTSSSTDGWPPTHGEVGLLVAAGGFSDAFLLPLAAHAEQVLPDQHGMLVSDPWSPWGVFGDPATTWLPAIAESPIAAGSQPRVLAQLLGLGQLSDADADVALLEAARRTTEDDTYAARLEAELAAVLPIDEEAAGRFTTELLALGYSLEVAGATRSTIAALQDRASQAGRDLRTSPDAATRSQAGQTLRNTPPWLRSVTSNPAFTVTSRALPAAGVGISLLAHLDAGVDPLEATVRTGAGFAGAWGAGAGAAKLASPLLAGGPPGWIAYGGTVLVSGIAGGFAGDTVAGWFFQEDPNAGLWFRDFGREGMPAPGPPEEIEWR